MTDRGVQSDLLHTSYPFAPWAPDSGGESPENAKVRPQVAWQKYYARFPTRLMSVSLF